jgi:hypothetical protein
MAKMTPAEALDLPFNSDDIPTETIRDYLKGLLSTLWSQGESFSGKRPFGNSGWEGSLVFTLVKAGCIVGQVITDDDDPEDSYVDEYDRKAYDKFVADMIVAL